MRQLGWSKSIVLEWKRLLREVCRYKLCSSEDARERKKTLKKYNFKFNSKKRKLGKDKEKEETENDKIETEWREQFREEPFSNLVAQIREIRPVV